MFYENYTQVLSLTLSNNIYIYFVLVYRESGVIRKILISVNFNGVNESKSERKNIIHGGGVRKNMSSLMLDKYFFSRLMDLEQW